MTNVISLHPASFGRRRDLVAPPYEPLPIGFADFGDVRAERLPCGWPVLPANVEVVTQDDGRLTVRPTPRKPVVIPADAPSPVRWADPSRAHGWRGALRRLFGRA